MAQKKKALAKVVSQKVLADGICDLWIKTDLAKDARPGQFVGVYPAGKTTLLPRPISICDVDADKSCLRLVYRVVGQGTAEFALYTEGDFIEILGILGNGYDLSTAAGKDVCLMGGGIGVPPMLYLAKELAHMENGPKSLTMIMGYRDDQTFLADEFAQNGKLLLASDNGSVGTKGTVLDAMREEGVTPEVIMSCGPMPMLRAIASLASDQGIKAYISLEERMACGVGACLGCITKTKGIDAHSHVNNTRICTDGPVFDSSELDFS